MSTDGSIWNHFYTKSVKINIEPPSFYMEQNWINYNLIVNKLS